MATRRRAGAGGTPTRRRSSASGSSSPRQEAFRILLRVETGGAWAGLLLRGLPATMPGRDRALATVLVMGVLRWQGRLDHALSQFSRRPLDAVEPALRIALRLAAYQILLLDRIPASAAVNESVGLARRAHGRGGAAFVNGVLRALAAGEPQPPGPLAEPEERLAILGSHPRWLVRRWIAAFGAEETEDLLAAGNRPPVTVLRRAPGAPSAAALMDELRREGVEGEISRWWPEALRVRGGSPAETRPYRRGHFLVQDEASQMVTALLPVAPGTRVADLCAAPGGKAADLMHRARATGGFALATDRSRSRIRLVRSQAERLGLPWRWRLLVHDAARPALRTACLDALLLDAPCSGTGILRRQPEIRWRRQEADVGRLAAYQAALLRAAAELLRPGGALVYSVCSMEPEEGPSLVERFLREEPGFRLEDPWEADCPVPRVLRAVGPPGPHLRTWPHRHDLDGFFAVRLRRDGGRD